MLSQKARYALHAVLYLARKGEPASVAEISEATDTPRKFLEQIMHDLKLGGIVLSRRGKGGGYDLARTPDTITFAQVLRCISGPLALAPCVSRTAYAPCPDCTSVETCEIRPILLAVRDTTALLLEGTSLSSAVDDKSIDAKTNFANQ
jgi:Rrf2 family protein